MSVVNYSKYKVVIDPKSKKTQGLSVGDVVRRQYFDYPNLIYSLMLVLETGVDVYTNSEGKEERSSYFIGGLLDGDEPDNGQLLDFVRVTNLFNSSRSGALYLTASDSDSPYMDVVDGMATENTLCYPYMDGKSVSQPDARKYTVYGSSLLTTQYTKSLGDCSRIYRVTRNSVANNNGYFGIKQFIEKKVKNPQRLIISYKVRSSKALSGVRVAFGDVNGVGNEDAEYRINTTVDWTYVTHVLTADLPETSARQFQFDLTNQISSTNDWFEISDLNIVLLADIGNFGKSTKTRVGKISGIIDPIFGTIDGYGAYFQNMYASKNVNIAGTLTAGDENGFASTFYVGKIRKNNFINSLSPNFSTSLHSLVQGSDTPVGLGNVYSLQTGVSKINAQTKTWLDGKLAKKYCLSFWVKSSDLANIEVSTNGNTTDVCTPLVANEWAKLSVTIPLSNPNNTSLDFSINVLGEPVLFTAPQLESGEKATIYQPTDSTLNDTEDYGAWFNRGGIGGTIQNPLLKLNSDGSISSANGSFVINNDGSGYFANGAIKWNQDKVELGKNVVLTWENLDDEAKTNLKGDNGVDANLLDWVSEWNGTKTTINSNTVLTPKIFAGTKNANNTITGIALGEFQLITINSSGSAVAENINGIYGFNAGKRTFSIDSDGTVVLGRGNDSIKFNPTTAKVEFGANVVLAWQDYTDNALGGSTFPKLTYISSTGIYTGTLTANQVNAVAINAGSIITGTLSADRIAANSINGNKIVAGSITADRITAGSITATQINTANLQANLITTSYIEGLSFNFTKGTIGNWVISSDGLTNGNVILTATGSIYHKLNKFSLSADGSGYLASGNISWDTTGDITFSDAVKLNWQNYTDDLVNTVQTTVNNVTSALGGSAYPKLTYISSTGIYTGTLTATQVNAVAINASSITTGTLNADRISVGSLNGNKIVAGSITATQVNTESLQANLITTVYIEGLSLNVIRGTIGGWAISTDGITNGNVQLTASGSVYHKLNKYSLSYDGSGYLASGNISWDVSGNITFANSVKLNWQNYTDSQVSNIRIGGTNLASNIPSNWQQGAYNGVNGIYFYTNDWICTKDYIPVYPNALYIVSVTGSIDNMQILFYRSDGSYIHSFDYLNTPYITPTDAAYAQVQVRRANYITPSDISSVKIKVEKGNKATDFSLSDGDIASYTDGQIKNIQIGGENILKNTRLNDGVANRIDNHYLGLTSVQGIRPSTGYIDPLEYITPEPIKPDTYYTLSFYIKGENNTDLITTYFYPSTVLSGITSQGETTNAIDGGIHFKVSTEWQRVWVTYKTLNNVSGIKNIITHRMISSLGVAGNKVWVCGVKLEEGNKATAYTPNSTEMIELSQNAQTTADNVTTALGGSSYPKLTQISATGIYTGSITASQIAAGSITSNQINTANLQANLVTASYIQGLSLNVTQGTIGGWNIDSDSISIGSVGTVGAIPIQIRKTSSGSTTGYWYLGDYRPYGLSMTWHQTGNAGHIVIGQIAAGGNSVKSGFYGIQMMSWNNNEYFCLSSNVTKVGSLEMYNRIAGWAFDSTTISKGNVSLGSDGTIQYSGKWRFANDGSGYIAAGNITWDAAGNATIGGNVKISGTSISNAITTDSISVGSNFSVSQTGILKAVNGEFSGTLSGVTGTFKELKALDSSGSEQGSLSFGSDARLWFNAMDLQHQGTKDSRSLRFYASDMYVRGSFGSRGKVTLVVKGSYGYLYANGVSSSGIYISFTSSTYSGYTIYKLPVYGSASDYAGIPIDLFVINHSSTYNYEFEVMSYKHITVVNGHDTNNNNYIWTNNQRIQLNGGAGFEMINIGDSNMIPTVLSSAKGAGWIITSQYDNNWA